MASNALIVGIVAGVVSLLMWYLTKSSFKKAVSREDGMSVMRLPRFYDGVGYASCGIALVLGGLIVFGVAAKRSDVIAIFGMIGLFGGPGLLILLITRERVEYSGSVVKSIGSLGKIREAQWHEITRMTHNTSTMVLTLYKAKTKIEAHLHMSGFMDLVAMVKRKCPPAMYGEAMDKMDRSMKRMGMEAGS